MSAKHVMTDSAKVREELLGSMRIEAFDDYKGIDLCFSGRCLDLCIDQLIGYAHEMLPCLYDGLTGISLSESLSQNLYFAVPGIPGAANIPVNVEYIHYYEMGLMNAADFVIKQANM